MATMLRILVPLDGSALAETALPWAELLAERTGATLVLLRSALVRGLITEDLLEAEVQAVQEAEEYVGRVAGALREHGLSVEMAVPYGEPGEAIVEASAWRSADLVVMATHGRSGLGRWVYGSVADHVLRGATVPVFLVRAGVAPPVRAALPSQVVVPLDGSEVAEAALPWAVELARLLGAGIALLRAVELPAFGENLSPRANVLEAAEVEARRYLEGVSDGLRRDGLELTYAVRLGTPAWSIASCARELGSSLLVMATHGRSAMARLVYGSVAAGVLREASVPLLLVPARGMEAGRRAARREPVVGMRDEALLGMSVTLSLTGRDVLLLREAVSTTLWFGREDETQRAHWRALLDTLPTADGLRSRLERPEGRAAAAAGAADEYR
ncbi:MAG: universal stress protein [Chloroflexi bacterium]|nr:universal stress protein [Chloroflexota bacterium]